MIVPVIKCENVTFKYPGSTVLENLDLVIDPGTLGCITGPNGSGKTTLLKLLAGLIVPSKGIVSIGKWNTLTNWRQARSYVGVSIYAERSYNFRLSGFQNARYSAALAGLTPEEGRSAIRKLVQTFDAESIFSAKFSDLSLGQRRIFGIIMAILTSNGIVLLDEPTATLDEINRRAVVSVLSAVRDAGFTVVTTTHDQHLIGVADGEVPTEVFCA